MRRVVLWVALLGAGCGSSDSGGSPDGGGAGTVVGSAECAAFCANIRNACGAGTHCDEDFFCRIRMDECAASARDRLACSAMMMPTCFDGGWLVPSCESNKSLCGDL